MNNQTKQNRMKYIQGKIDDTIIKFNETERQLQLLGKEKEISKAFHRTVDKVAVLNDEMMKLMDTK